jgi:hypothetical protein
MRHVPMTCAAIAVMVTAGCAGLSPVQRAGNSSFTVSYNSGLGPYNEADEMQRA